MQLTRSEVVAALEQCKGAVADKAFVPILTHVLFRGGRVVAYDSEIGISVKINSPAELEFNVKHGPFLDLMRRLDEEEVHIDVTDKAIKLTCGTHRSSLPQIKEEFPRLQVDANAGDWMDVPAGLKEATERVLLAVSEDENNRTLSAVYMSGQYVYGGDGKMMVRCEVGGMASPAFLLPRKAAAEVVKLGNPSRMLVKGAVAAFDYTNLTFICRLREGGDYPSGMFDKLLGTRTTSYSVPDALTGALSRLKLVADGESKITVSQEALGLELSAANGMGSDGVELLEPWEVEVPRKGASATRMLSLLPYTESMDWGATGNDALYFTGEVAGFQALLAPMALNGAA